MALPRGAMGLSAVCDCGISRSYSLTIFDDVVMDLVCKVTEIITKLRFLYIVFH